MEKFKASRFLDLTLSSIIGTFNVLLTIIIELTIRYELFLKKTDELSSIIYRITFKMFLNSSLNLLIVSLLSNSEEYNLYRDVMYFTFLCAFFYPAFTISNYRYLYFLFVT